jgi:hypothetical protein
MACFSLEWVENLFIWLVVVLAVIAVLRILVPWIFQLVGFAIDARFWQILRILMGAIIAIYLIVVVFGLIRCLYIGAGMHPLIR